MENRLRSIKSMCFKFGSTLTVTGSFVAVLCSVSFGQGGGGGPTPCGPCYMNSTAPCPTAPGVPCVDQECIYDPAEDDGRGAYVCMERLLPPEGKIGFHDIQESYTKAELITPTTENPPASGKCETTHIEDYCWIRKGCPTTGCTEVTDPINPQVFRYYCSAPTQTGIKEGADDASILKSSSQTCVPTET